MMSEARRNRDDDLELSLNPHRAEERAVAVMESRARLHRRGIEVAEREEPQDVVDLLSAVERFEEMVEMRGGDLMVDDLRSSEPDDRHFVVPRRRAEESLRDYISRIEEATVRLRAHPAQPERHE